MDDILEPNAADIGKWKSSKTATSPTNLHAQLREASAACGWGRRASGRMAWASIPNSVAEYLDNTLPAEQVGEFEKVCLESDVHLAEVGACHQILTLVLGEPAEVDRGARRADVPHRIRKRGGRAASAAAAATPVMAAAGGPSSEAAPTPSKPRPEVPDYLRGGSRSRFWPIVGTLLAVCLLAVVVVSCFGLDSNNPVIRWFYGNPKGPETPP